VNYSNAWKAHYVEQGYQAVDPTLFIGMRSVAALDWRRIDQDEGFRRVFRDATDFGITERGFSVPVRGPMGDVGLLSVTKKCSNLRWDSLVERNLGALQVTASRMHETVMRSDRVNAMLRRTPLSTREREILTWAARGKSPAAIASILAIGTGTVEMILGSVFQKLNVVNVNPAVDEAAALGLLTAS
jgi:DNA-binding CsgD family transcriptional regulator